MQRRLLPTKPLNPKLQEPISHRSKLRGSARPEERLPETQGLREACLVRPPSIRMRGRPSRLQSLAEPLSRAEAGRAWDRKPAS